MLSSRRKPPVSNSRALRDKELFLIKKPSRGGDMRVHLVYPNTYWVGMSSLGFQAVFKALASAGGVAVERGFLPEEFRGTKNRPPRLTTFESERDLSDCDLLAVSLSFESDYLNFFKMLNALNLLKPRSAPETQTEPHYGPLLMAGGVAVTLNPEPIAEYVDLVFLGEAEEFIPEFVEAWREVRKSNMSWRGALEHFAQIEGVYAPALFKPCYAPDGKISAFRVKKGGPFSLRRPKRRVVKDLTKYQTSSAILTPETEFRSMFLVETGRGCEQGCRFCASAYIYRPVRKQSSAVIKSSLALMPAGGGTVGFMGASVSSHPGIIELMQTVRNLGRRAALSSLMAQKVNREMAAGLQAHRVQSAALAPEAGSERLRFAIGKRVKDTEFVEACRLLAEAGVYNIKLYFMVGLPTETDKEVEEIAVFSRKLVDTLISSAEAKRIQVTVSLNAFVPKAFTPFAWEPMCDVRELVEKIKRLSKLFQGNSRIKFAFEPPKQSYFQALLSRGDRRLGMELAEVVRKGGGWKELLKLAARKPWLRLYVERRLSFEELLPWDIIDGGVSKEMLIKEALRAGLNAACNVKCKA